MLPFKPLVFTLIAWLFLNPAVLAFEMSGSIFKITADINNGAGSAYSPSFAMQEFAIGSFYGSSGGSTYNVTVGGISPIQLIFLIGAPSFSPAEILVTFWRK